MYSPLKRQVSVYSTQHSLEDILEDRLTGSMNLGSGSDASLETQCERELGESDLADEPKTDGLRTELKGESTAG